MQIQYQDNKRLIVEQKGYVSAIALTPDQKDHLVDFMSGCVLNMKNTNSKKSIVEKIDQFTVKSFFKDDGELDICISSVATTLIFSSNYKQLCEFINSFDD